MIKGSTHSNIKFEANSNPRSFRHHNLFRPAAARTTVGEKTIEVLGMRIFNKLPPAITSARHQHEFKWVLRCHLRNMTFISTCFTAEFFNLTLAAPS